MRTLVLYGNSLALTTIGITLQECADMQVVRVDARVPDAMDRLEALKPDIIIFDLVTVRPELNISLWKVNPQVRLIGVDLARNELLLLSGQQATARSAKDLLELVNGLQPGSGELQNVASP